MKGDGSLDLPQQNGYCFVLNHYNLELAFQNKFRPYEGVIRKYDDQGHLLNSDDVARRIIPTANQDSVEVASVCMDGLAGASKISIAFSMYNASDRTISFGVK